MPNKEAIRVRKDECRSQFEVPDMQTNRPNSAVASGTSDWNQKVVEKAWPMFTAVHGQLRLS